MRCCQTYLTTDFSHAYHVNAGIDLELLDTCLLLLL